MAELAAEERGCSDCKRRAAIARRPAGGTAAVAERVRRLYLQEYIKIWDQYIADVRWCGSADLERSVEVARLLAAPIRRWPATCARWCARRVW